MRLASRLVFILLITLAILKWPRIAEAQTLYCSESYTQCMTGCGSEMEQCSENNHSSGPPVEWCTGEEICWTAPAGMAPTCILDVDCYSGENNSQGQFCAQSMANCSAGCKANNCYWY